MFGSITRFCKATFGGKKYDLVWHNYVPEVIGFVLWSVLTTLFYHLVLPNDTSVIGWTAFTMLILTILSYRGVEAPQRWVIEFLNLRIAVWSSGPHFLFPGFFIRAKTTLALQEFDLFVDGKDHTFKDFRGNDGEFNLGEMDFTDESAPLEMSAFLRVTSPYRVAYAVDNLNNAFVATVKDAIRGTFADLRLDDALRVKTGSSRLVMSYFLRDADAVVEDEDDADDEGTNWQAIRELDIYSEGGDGTWLTGTEIGVADPTPNRFLVARSGKLPSYESVDPEDPTKEEKASRKKYILSDWGLAFAGKGFSLSDVELSEATKLLRRELLKKKRDRQVAAIERVISELEGLGERDRLNALTADGNLTPQEAVAYSAAIRLMEKGTLRDKTLVMSLGEQGLDVAKLASIFGVTSDAVSE